MTETQGRAGLDSLTRIADRSTFDTAIEAEFQRARVISKPLSILFVDIDQFKNVNETYGDLAGDAVLRWLAATMQAGIRSTDLVARYGGEEFVIVLTETSTEEAFVVAERFREQIASERCAVDDRRELTVTVSIGCATMLPETGFTSTKELVDAADQALYAAKLSGGNRTCEAGHPAMNHGELDKAA